ncbi:PH domain-containing protein [Sinosporangium album]|uniref:PH domain-containing protein n=1 Tax=Sinosporangium album TaxID=504805 RepID=A0A1G7W2W2_9ACTN|nr:PH domain-containing protein [Sinosporangium album]
MLSFQPHRKQLLGPLVALVLIAAASGAAIYFIPSDFEYALHARVGAGVLAVILMTIWSFVPYLQWTNTAYTLTTHRFTASNGVLSKSIDEIPIAKVNTVSSDQSFVERLLGSGTLTIESAGEHGRLAFRDIPKIQDVRAELFRLTEEAAGEDDASDPEHADPEHADPEHSDAEHNDAGPADRAGHADVLAGAGDAKGAGGGGDADERPDGRVP